MAAGALRSSPIDFTKLARTCTTADAHARVADAWPALARSFLHQLFAKICRQVCVTFCALPRQSINEVKKRAVLRRGSGVARAESAEEARLYSSIEEMRRAWARCEGPDMPAEVATDVR